jgi:hypothetical protein
MPNLAQMFALANARSANSRPEGEIYSALDEAGFLVYTAVLKEFSGFFLKFDTTSIVLTPGTNIYPLPADLTQMVAIAERLTAAERWRPMDPTTLADSLFNTQDLVGWNDWEDLYGEGSEFEFYGPYLPAVAPGVAQVQSISVKPAIDVVRMCEIAYTAKWLPVVNEDSVVMLPNEGTYAMQNFAIAELNRANNDTLSAEYEAKGKTHLAAFLTWVRNRQLVKWPTITPYLSD